MDRQTDRSVGTSWRQSACHLFCVHCNHAMILQKQLRFQIRLQARDVCRILESGFVLDNSKQKYVKFLNIHQNSHENEVILAKRVVRATPLNPLWIRPCCKHTFCHRQIIEMETYSSLTTVSLQQDAAYFLCSYLKVDKTCLLVVTLSISVGIWFYNGILIRDEEALKLYLHNRINSDKSHSNSGK